MIRILHVIDSLDLGGAQTVLVNLARFRDRGKFDVTVAAMHGRGVFAEALAAQGEAGVLSLEVDPDGLIGKFGAGCCAVRDFELLVSEAGRLLAEPESAAAAGRGAARMVAEWLDNNANTYAFLRGVGA